MAAPFTAEPFTTSSSGVAASTAPKRVFPRRLLLWLVVAGMISVLALPLAVVFDGRFPVANLDVEMTNRIRNNRHDAIAWAKERSNRWESMYRTTVACLAGFGALMGGVAAFLGAVPQSSLLKKLQWFAAGVCLGGVAAALGGYLEAGLLIKIEKLPLDPTLRTMLGHGLAWMVLGLGVALAATFSATSWSERLVAVGRACLGAILATITYSPVAAVAFQLVRSDLPIPEGTGNKLLFLGTAGLALFGMLGSRTDRQFMETVPSVDPAATPVLGET